MVDNNRCFEAISFNNERLERNGQLSGKMGNNKMTDIFNPYGKEIDETLERIKKATDERNHAAIRSNLSILRNYYNGTGASYLLFIKGLEEKISKDNISADAKLIIEFLLNDTKKVYEDIKESLRKTIMLQNDYELEDFERQKSRVDSLVNFMVKARN